MDDAQKSSQIAELLAERTKLALKIGPRPNRAHKDTADGKRWAAICAELRNRVREDAVSPFD